MPLPLILGVGVVVASCIQGGRKRKETNDIMNAANYRHQKNLERFREQREETSEAVDKLGKLELNILESFKEFSDVFEKIQNRPVFAECNINGVEIPKYDCEELKEVSAGAGILLGGLCGAALGKVKAFAASRATTAAVLTLGTASTGTAIASLSGAAANNATLAALCGGAIAARAARGGAINAAPAALDGGAIAAGGATLGTTFLGAPTLGFSLRAGGITFNDFIGKGLSVKADEAWDQMIKAEKQIDKICKYLSELSKTAKKYTDKLRYVNMIYNSYLSGLSGIVTRRTGWALFDNDEKRIAENTVLIVGLLYNMCKVQIVKKSEIEGELDTVNNEAIESAMNDADRIITDPALRKIEKRG